MYRINARQVRYILFLISIYGLEASVVATELNVITKSQWNGAEAAKAPTKHTLPIGRVIVMHKDGGDCQNLDACSQQVRNIQSYHTNNQHFDDIAYNFLSGNDGSVYEGRGWEFVGNFNKGLSMAFIGTCGKSAPSELVDRSL